MKLKSYTFLLSRGEIVRGKAFVVSDLNYYDFCDFSDLLEIYVICDFLDFLVISTVSMVS